MAVFNEDGRLRATATDNRWRMTTGIPVLLVEDEALLHDMLEEGLGDAGFEVLILPDGEAALAELDKDASRFRAIVTDIRLGAGPCGWEIGQHARELVADMPIVYMSGDSAEAWASRGVPASIMVRKPFAVAQIVTALATLLNKETL